MIRVCGSVDAAASMKDVESRGSGKQFREPRYGSLGSPDDSQEKWVPFTKIRVRGYIREETEAGSKEENSTASHAQGGKGSQGSDWLTPQPGAQPTGA